MVRSGNGLIRKSRETVVVPHSLVTDSLTVCVPFPTKLTVPGLAALEVAGVPPLNVQAYVSAPDPQLVTNAEGVIETGPQASLIAAIDTVGGLFTSTFLLVENVPQALVMLSVMVYLPALLKINSGANDEALPEANDHDEELPQ